MRQARNTMPLWLPISLVLGLLCLPALAPAASAQFGFYNDEFSDDDWYDDYYGEGTNHGEYDASGFDSYGSRYDSNFYGFGTGYWGSYDGDDEYDASQFYDDAGDSGLFDV